MLREPGIREELEPRHDRERRRHRCARARRQRDERAPSPSAESILGRNDAGPRPPLRPRPRDRRRSRPGSSPGPWVAHVSGGTPLTALDPHGRRFSLHPLQTFTHDRGAGAARRRLGGRHRRDRRGPRRRRQRSPDCSGCGPFLLADERRALYHAGAVDRVELPRHPASGRRRAARGGRRAARGARAAHAPRDRQRLPADRPDRARRLGDGRAAPRRDRRAPRRTCSPRTTPSRALTARDSGSHGASA